MIAVDTSAIVAILLNEPEAQLFAQTILSDADPLMSAGSLIDLHRVMRSKKGEGSRSSVDEMMATLDVRPVEVTARHVAIACEATYAYPILNYGDVFSYALAMERDIPLLY